MGDILELELWAGSDRYEPDDPRFREQVSSLVERLRREAGPARTERYAAADTKGASEASSVIIALGTSGALTIALNAFKEWLRRDRTRSLRISWVSAESGRRTLIVKAEELDRAGFQELAKLALTLEDSDRRPSGG